MSESGGLDFQFKPNIYFLLDVIQTVYGHSALSTLTHKINWN